MNTQKVMQTWFLCMGLSMIIICLRVKINCNMGLESIGIIHFSFAIGFIGSISVAFGNMLGNGIYLHLKKNLKNERYWDWFRGFWESSVYMG